MLPALDAVLVQAMTKDTAKRFVSTKATPILGEYPSAK